VDFICDTSVVYFNNKKNWKKTYYNCKFELATYKSYNPYINKMYNIELGTVKK